MTRSFILFVGFIISACTTAPIVDTQGKSMAQYEQDLADCKAYQNQVNTGQKIAVGTVAGAVIGTAVGAAVGNSDTAQKIAGAGAVTGSAKGLGRAMDERRRVVFNCLRQRGYAVLN